MQKNELDTYLLSYTKFNPRRIVNLNAKYKAIQIPEENRGENVWL